MKCTCRLNLDCLGRKAFKAAITRTPMEFIDAYVFDDEEDVAEDEVDDDEEEEKETKTTKGRPLNHSTYVNASLRRRVNYTNIGTDATVAKGKATPGRYSIDRKHAKTATDVNKILTCKTMVYLKKRAL